jgi:hypothetical protein
VVAIDLGTIIPLIPALLGIWIIVSIPVYLAAKVVTSGRARFTQAMGATILGPVAYLIVVIISMAVLGSIVGGMATLPAIILALLVWLWVYKSSFKTGWWAAIGIALLAIIVFIAASFILMFVLGIVAPDVQQPPLPSPFHQA